MRKLREERSPRGRLSTVCRRIPGVAEAAARRKTSESEKGRKVRPSGSSERRVRRRLEHSGPALAKGEECSRPLPAGGEGCSRAESGGAAPANPVGSRSTVLVRETVGETALCLEALASGLALRAGFKIVHWRRPCVAVLRGQREPPHCREGLGGI